MILFFYLVNPTRILILFLRISIHSVIMKKIGIIELGVEHKRGKSGPSHEPFVYSFFMNIEKKIVLCVFS